ncbi:penicillin-binding protein [Lacticaseibacillus casei]|uniref:Transglycosylase domain-containing protein n=1 Tax=Lacticaseibacillus huelsenbergensis TaxID=3035291 RepID=A0ABY8DN31_9LACO|nr:MULTISPECIES: transglycosylase domain-containing protein [Lacticaseibacillus]MDG3062962.1 transglycosylase domain-containing protein [Lacticaseibacillus sp. BCRC 81376]QVI38328.1 penicillin-binding protein [Lacticaseibacillus casei]QXG60141.1 penicillin-binding protein [Lacticaseibacillus casei]WFB38383.1 transglycosylase domain-containing protein [Lacticaseibacillus huelsenbergensis]WFB42807.1 transglycosylase domain-containing protein [Lacticaseibacillus huelsenbergensis]
MKKFVDRVKTLGTRFRRWFTAFVTRRPDSKADSKHLTGKTAVVFYGNVTLQSIKSIVYYLLGVLGIAAVFGLGLFGGYFVSIIDATPIPTEAAMKATLSNTSRTSSMYFAHNVKLSDVKSDLYSTKVSLSDMSPWLTKAIIATEDEDFYRHDGVVPKAVIRAFFSDLTGMGNQTGGSTLTQQVVKMMFLNSETTFKRKAAEIMLARRLNNHFSKNEILETYLNVATLGRNNKGQNIAGVEAAAQGLFGVSASQVNLPEAAFIAGLPQSPFVYTPYTADGQLKASLKSGINRQQTVLFRMYRAGVISHKQYVAAKSFDLKGAFLKPENAEQDDNEYGYVYNMVLSEAKSLLAEKLAQNDGHSAADLAKDNALNNDYLRQAGDLFASKNYQIKSTINKDVYDRMQFVMRATRNTFGQTYTSTQINPKTGETETVKHPVQNGSVVLDNQTGAVLGFVGGVSGELNHIYTLRSPGSTIKPLLVYAPAIDQKVIGSQTALADFKTNLGNNYSVTDYGDQIQNRFIPATEALAQSYNIPAVNLYKHIKPNVNVKSYMEKMGIDTLTDNDYSQLGLALGGTDYGVDVKEQASAFSTFANEGEHVPAYVISEIVDPSGHAVYRHHVKKTKVFSEGTNYIMNQMLKNVVESGTAESLNYQLRFNTDNLIGKTGTSNDFRDIWFIGSTPGVTIASWMGYDNSNGTNYTLDENSSMTNEAYWSKLANAVYHTIPKQFKVDKKLARPSTVKSVTVDKQTGQPAGTLTFNGRTYHTGGSTVTSLYNDWQPTAKAEFGIGGSKDNYQLFYDHLNGKSNGYGQVSDANGRSTEAKKEHQETPITPETTTPATTESSQTPSVTVPSSQKNQQGTSENQPSEPQTTGTGGTNGATGTGGETTGTGTTTTGGNTTGGTTTNNQQTTPATTGSGQ